MSSTEMPSSPAMPEPGDTAPAAATPTVAVEPTEAAVPAEAEAAPAAAQPAAAVDAQAVGAELKRLFPALFGGAPKPLKLRIQADIQERAPGQFSKQQLSAFLRRYTGGTGYLVALTRAKQRFDLDGQGAGEISAEHLAAAQQELTRRRGITEGRRAEEDQQRQQRAQLLRDFSRTTLTPANFCALKGLTPEQLEQQLARAREEAAQQPPRPPQGGERSDRGPRRDGREGPDGREGRGPRNGRDARGPGREPRRPARPR